MTGRRPWLKWYPADWRAEPTLRMCSRAARSLWVDLLGLMHDGEPYGHLTVAGIVPTPKQLASLLGDTERDTVRLLAELEAAGVFSRDPAGRIFCRRMLRDKARDDRDRANGKWGGNPAIVKSDNGGVNPHSEEVDNGGDKAQKLEARSQIPEAREENTPPPSGSAPSEGKPPDNPAALRRTPGDRPPVPDPAPPKRGTRLPADWTLSPELRAWAIAEGLADPDREAAKFRDHWTAKAGKDATKLDWAATWRTWVRKAIDWQKEGRGNGQAEQAQRGHDDSLLARTKALLAERDARLGAGDPGGAADAVLPAVPGGR